MGRRVFYAEAVQPGNEAVVVVDFGPSLELAGEVVPSANSVDVTIRERESRADVTAGMFVAGSAHLSDNSFYTFRVVGLSDNYDYVATAVPRTNLRPSGADEVDVVIPVRARVRRAFAPVGP